MSKTYSNNHYLKKSLGQNFLKTEKYIIPLISLINKNDLVIEVGAGKGFITDKLYSKTQNIILVEKDQRFENTLKSKYPKAKIYIQDVLNFEIKDLNKYKMVGALPYYISKDIISKFLKNEKRVKSISVILQKEVAKKYTTKGDLLYNTVHIYAEKILPGEIITKENFYPIPKVDSQIIHITNIYKYNKEDEKIERFIKRGYRFPRKKLKNNIHEITKFKDLRAENLSFEDWIELYNDKLTLDRL